MSNTKKLSKIAVSLSTMAMFAVAAGFTLGQQGCPNYQTVGTATCLACHDGRSAPDMRQFANSPHNGFECETCHGPGYLHVRNGGAGGLFVLDPNELPFAEAAAFCGRCHEHDDELNGFLDTAHAKSQAVTCQDCHDVHTRNALVVASSSPDRLDNDGYAQLCGTCHEGQVDEFLLSGHVTKDAATCGSCHNMHQGSMLTANTIDNSICQQCHGSSFLGLDTPAAVNTHTGPMHPVDPAGSGASRCIGCHMPPQLVNGQPDVPHDHTLFTVPPAVSNQEIAMGQAPSPNSCAGTMGCHDGSGPGLFHNLNDTFVNENLQAVYETIGTIP